MMTLKKVCGKAWGLLVVLLAFSALVITVSYYSYGDAKIETPEQTWYEESAGYHKALALQDETGKPMFVYVYAPWCPYCKQFQKETLANEGVQHYLEQYIKVKLYPGTGAAEKAISDQLKAPGFPSLYLKLPVNPVYYPISRLAQQDGKWVLASPEEFIQNIELLRSQATP